MSTFTLKLNAARTSPAWQLALDKFPFRQGATPSLPEKKIDALKPATNSQWVKPHWEPAIKSKVEWLATLARQHGPRFRRVTLVNSSRLLLHLGRSSVLENVGLHCERATGLPVIPGTAVKGVVSTWACWTEHFDQANYAFREFSEASKQRRNFTQSEARLASVILGDNASSGSTAGGDIVFLGAFPQSAPKLELDIVTPHTDAAGQDRAPVPNPFLAVAAGSVWDFALLATSRCADREVAAMLDQAESWLKEAIFQAGLGAKTASGYGRFLPPSEWEAATLDEAEKSKRAAAAEREAAKAANLAAIQAAQVGDYANEATFKNLVLAKLNPGQLNQLESEIKKLRANPDNEPWQLKLVEALKGREMKDLRKKLKDKPWFPQEWLQS